MNIRIKILLSFLLCVAFAQGQRVNAVYKISDLLKRIDQTNDTIYVLNFWATWCIPCVKELPEIDSFAMRHKNEKVKVLLVSLDFREEIEKKVDPFLKKNNYKTECVLLDEVNGNDFIDKIDKRWTGSIPATFFTFNNRRKVVFVEKKIGHKELEEMLLQAK